jgi:membrane protein YqaA with SNARE-associated domain
MKPRVHHSLIPHWLTHLGALGLFAVAVLDSSVLPLPLPGSTDLLLLWLVAHHGIPWLLVLSATLGSIVGGYTNWSAGKKGGEAAIAKYGSHRVFKRLSIWVEHHSVLSLFVPAILPPPIPLQPFLLASGALGISRNHFLLAFGAGRVLRYSLIAWLGVRYGRHIVGLWSKTLQAWSGPLIWTFVAIMVASACFGLWRIRREKASGKQGGKTSPVAA